MTGLDNLPPFMASVVRYSDPGFNPDDLLPDMGVVVIRHGWTPAAQGEYRGKVLSKGRVLVKVQEIGHSQGQPQIWTFRMDTQRENGNDTNYGYRFRTMAQHEYRAVVISARDFLDEQGVSIDRDSPWTGSYIELARLIWPGRKGEQAPGD